MNGSEYFSCKINVTTIDIIVIAKVSSINFDKANLYDFMY